MPIHRTITWHSAKPLASKCGSLNPNGDAKLAIVGIAKKGLRVGAVSDQTKLTVIMHADVVDSTRLVHQDEYLAHERVRDLFRRFAAVIADFGGVTHEVRGDALVAEFERASDASIAALDFQASNIEHNATLSGNTRPCLRVGIAIGEVIIADGTITGAGVVLAQRLEQLAEANGVCVSAAIREAVPARLSLTYEDMGARVLKGFDEFQNAYSIRKAEVVGEEAPRKSDGAETRAERISIAVLRFTSRDPEGDGGFLAEGLSEDLIDALSRYRWFDVVARSSSFAHEGQTLDVRKVGADLGARYIVEGNVRRSGERLRISVQLEDAELGTQVWSERYERHTRDMFELQDELTQKIAGALGPELSDAEQERIRRIAPDSLAAWEHYQRGRWHIRKSTGQDAREARRWLTSALELDPEFSAALAARAYASLQVMTIGGERKTEGLLELALKDARAAVALDSRDPYAHFVLGRALSTEGRHEGSARELTRAIELNPSDAEANVGLGLTLQWSGRSDESIPYLERAMVLSPHGPPGRTAQVYIGFAHHNMRRYRDAVEALEGAIEKGAGYVWLHLTLAAAYAQLGRMESATEALTNARHREPKLSLGWVENALGSSAVDDVLDHLLIGLRLAGLDEQES